MAVSKREDELFMRLAVEKAREGIKKKQSPFGVCIIRNAQVITCVHNEVWQRTDITAHAEIGGIREACHVLNTVDLSGCALYSTTEPCPMCFGAIHWARISRVVYGASISDGLQAGFNELTISNVEMKRLGGSPVEVTGGCLKEECITLFNEWLRLGGNPY